MLRRWLRTHWLFLFGLLLLGLFLFSVRAALVPFVYALLLTYLLLPAVNRLVNRGVNRLGAIILVYVGLMSVLIVALLGVVPSALAELESFADAVPKYTKEISLRLNEMQHLYSKISLPAGLRQIIDENIARLENTILAYVRWMAAFTVALFSHMLALIFAPILAFYMLRDWPLLKKHCLELFPIDDYKDLGLLLERLDFVLNGFIRGHLLVASIVALITFMGLAILRVDFALLIGIGAGMLDIIPYFGPIIGALPAVTIALLESPVKALYVMALFVLIHQFESAILSPKILGDRVGLHPLTVIFVLLAGGQLAGIVGILLAVPVAAGLKACWDFWGEGGKS